MEFIIVRNLRTNLRNYLNATIYQDTVAFEVEHLNELHQAHTVFENRMSENFTLPLKCILTIVILVIVFVPTINPFILFESDILVKSNDFHVGINQKRNVSYVTTERHLVENQRAKRAATARKERIWDFGVVPFVIDEIFSGDEKAGFKQAMRHWENYTCIKFVERNASEHKDFIRFTELPCGCCSHVGKQGNGAQNVSIGKNCHRIGVIVHELGHAVGFWHEHTRPDRDNYVKIHSDNILNGHEHNFDKLTAEDVDSLGEPYDHNSIMHYAQNTYSKNSFDATIVSIKGENMSNAPKIGQRKRLSRSDIIQANRLYKCPKCGETFLGQKASFASPNYRNAIAKRNYQCEWRISATHGERIRVKISDLEIFPSIDCQSDYLEIRDGYWTKSPLLGRFCGNISNLAAIMSTGNRMILTYKSNHSEYRGFAANYEAICGGNLTIINGNKIESPNYPQLYLPNKVCVWVISVPASYQVALEFYSFDLEPNSVCRRDFIEVRDGDNAKSRLIGKYCGNALPPILASTSNRMYIRFVSDGSGEGRGFSAALFQEIDECTLKDHGCEQNCINTLDGYSCTCRFGFKLRNDMKTCESACGGVTNATNGIIESPSFPNPYPANEECIWEIVAREPYRITLNFQHFQLEGSHLVQEECDYDSVSISSKYRDGQLVRHALYCSELLPPPITSETSIMRIKFKSDRTVQKLGFQAHFSTVIDRCAINNGGCAHSCRNTVKTVECSCKSGFVLHTNGYDCIPGGCRYEIGTPEGRIRSPHFPKNYSKNMDCIWHFKAIHGHRPYLQFEQFDIEDGYECSNDYVSVYIRVDERKRFYVTGETYTLGQFCGSNIPDAISSPADDIYMTFKSDSSVQRLGFVVNHSTVCGGHFVATTDIKYIYSHARFGDTFYENNTDCDWIILVKQAQQRIHLTFVEFDVEDEKACSFDFVDLYEERQHGKWIMHGRYCGAQKHVEIIASGRLLLQFRTDSSVRRKGFSVSYNIANATIIRDYQSGSSRFSRLSNTKEEFIQAYY